MKKLVSASLILALLAVSPVGAVHAEKPVKESDKGKDEEKAEKESEKAEKEREKANEKAETVRKAEEKAAEAANKAKEKVAEEEKRAAEKAAEAIDPATGLPNGENSLAGKKEAVQQAVKTKKELIELRAQLKKSQEVTEELRAKYEELTKQLEAQSELKQALKVQKELLDRFYKPGDQKTYKRLGNLYQKSGEEGLKTFVNGKEIVMDTAPFLEKGRALVPVRAISASLKAEVNWSPETRTVEVVRGENKIVLHLDSGEAEVNGEKIKLDAKPFVKNGRVFLPLRFIGEKLNAKVDYQETGDIIIEDQQSADQAGSGTEATVEDKPASAT
ncbi:stalk domain-containing protein [Brevibacillus borstelensis]|uniref:stalk domain-containing protein n=1 Tax=Brevibacillus borstelensis TaxID=45462 RepID=UPI0030BD9DE0